MNSILYVFLPCKKVYPIGITYLADFIHRRRPEVRQQILDLSLFPASQRSQALRDATKAFKPDLVCFSWRDIQIFSPHEGDSSLEHAFNFYFASNPIKRVVASFEGLKQLYRYYSHIYPSVGGYVAASRDIITYLSHAEPRLYFLCGPAACPGRRRQ